MKLLDRFRNRAPAVQVEEPSSFAPSQPDTSGLPIAGYDGLGEKEVNAQLSALSQADLALIERHESAHLARPAVLNRLRWLMGPEPIEGYDDLEGGAIVSAMEGANAQVLKEIRDYERRHRNRREVLEEVVRALPKAPESAEETRFREEQAERVSKALKKSPPPQR